MRWLCALLAVAALAPAPAQAQAQAQAGERISLPRLGIAMTVPDGWQRISPEEAIAHIADTSTVRAAYRREVGRAGLPAIALRKAPLAEYAGPVPILNVLFQELVVDRTAMEVMQRTARVSRRAIAGLEILEAPHAVRISGRPGAHMRVAYTTEQGGIAARGISEYWVVVRGGFYFAFTSGYSPDEPPATRAAIHAAVASVRLDPAD
jgi:hypothetical protein